MREATYTIAQRGMATSFTESEIPIEFAKLILNRTIDSAGGAEKRQGISQTLGALAGIENYHEFVDKAGVVTLYATKGGQIYRDDSGTWTLVFTHSSAADILSIQMGNRMIFTNGVNPNIFTEDKGITFSVLQALVIQGKQATASSTILQDGDVTDWLTTEANINDLVINHTVNGRAIVTDVTASSLAHTAIDPTGTGFGKTADAVAVGDIYQVIDLVELNIFQTDVLGFDDNTATAGAGTGTTTIAVSGVDFSTTDIKPKDFIRNTTRAAAVIVSAVSTVLTVTSVASQVAGDSLVFLKSAMPLTSFPYVYFNRAYYVDARDQRKVRISGSNDPQDLSTDAATLDPISFNFDMDSGGGGPAGDIIKAVGSYQRYLVLAGRKAVYVYSGTDPFDANFKIVGSFPQGVVSKFGLLDIGNDLFFVSDDGVQSIRTIATDPSVDTLSRAGIAEPIRITLRDLIKTTPEGDIRLVHYVRRSWVILKVGSLLFIYNYQSSAIDQENLYGGTWSQFDGPFAQQQAYLTRTNGDLLCGRDKTFLFDQGVYSDDGSAIATKYQTGRLTLEKPKSSTVRVKRGVYLKWLIESGVAKTYTFTATGGYEGEGNETGVGTSTNSASIGQFIIGTDAIGSGSGITNQKIPLRWRGEVVEITAETNDTDGPDVLGRYTIYGNIYGKK